MAKVNIRESLGRLDLLTDNKYDLRNTYDSSNISNDKKKKLAESISNNASAKQLYSILNESFEEPGVNVTEEMSDTIRTGMLSGMVGNDIWEVFFESGPTDVLDSDLEDISDDVFDGRLSGKTSRGIGWQIRVGYNDDYYDYNCLNCPDDDYVGSRWEEYDESLTEDTDDEYNEAKCIDEGKIWDSIKNVANKQLRNHYYNKAIKAMDKGNTDKEMAYIDKAVKHAEKTKEYKQGMQQLQKDVDNTKDKFEKDKQKTQDRLKKIKEESLTEDTVKQNGKWVNKGSEGTHGKFRTKKAADAQRKAMFANGYKGESLEESVEDSYMKHADADARKVKSLYRNNKDIDSVFSSLGYTDNGDGSYEKEVEDNVFIVFEYDEDSERLEYKVVNEETRTGTPSNVLNLSKKLKERVQRIDEDWEPDEWEETDFLDNDGKKVYINIIKEAEDIDDLKDIAHDLYWHDKGLFAMLRHFPKDKSFEWIQNRMIEVIKSTMNESLTEASYGGAYDIEDDMFWTKDDLIEFSDAVCEKLADKFGYQYDIADVGAENNNDMYITIMDTTHDIEADVSFRIKMSRIRSPRDLMKYLDTVVSEFVKKFEEEYQYYDFDESLKEAIDDEVEFDEFEETNFNDGEVEEGDTFIEDGRTWSWIERIAGPIHLDFDNWSVWSARDWDYIEEKVKPLLINKEEFNVEVLTKIYDEAEVAYFVVDEDTGFIDWGPVESQTEAQDFLNGKIEDWENDDEYDESLKESKQLKESSDITDNGYSYTLHYEDIGDGKEYDYEVSSDEMFDFLNAMSWENGDGPEDIDMEDHEQWDNWVANNIDNLIKEYEDSILDHFREDASQEEYDNRDSDDREYDY